MKICISSMGDKLSSDVDLRFGRAAKFIMLETDNDSFTVVDNAQNVESMQGAGIQAAQKVVDAGAGVLITPNCGPKAYRVLSSAGVKVYKCGEGKVSDILNEYKNGKLEELSEANVEGHWM